MGRAIGVDTGLNLQCCRPVGGVDALLAHLISPQFNQRAVNALAEATKSGVRLGRPIEVDRVAR